MEVKIELDINRVAGRISERLERAQKVLDYQIAKDSNFYAPEDKGDLKDSVFKSMTIGTGVLLWDIIYARVLYHGLKYNFSKDKNPNAQAKWFEVAKAARIKEWVKVAQNEFSR